jgi:hypothetical protein
VRDRLRAHPVRESVVLNTKRSLPGEMRAEAFRREQVRVALRLLERILEQWSGRMKGTSERAKASCHPAEMPGCGNDLWPSRLDCKYGSPHLTSLRRGLFALAPPDHQASAKILSVQTGFSMHGTRGTGDIFEDSFHAEGKSHPKETSMNQDKNQQNQGGQNQGGQQGGGETMPFSRYKTADSDLMEAMREAFYRVCDILQLSFDRKTR